MSLKFSQGVVNAIASGMGWGEILRNSVCVVYSGAQPTSPEVAATAGTELVRFTTNGGTLTAETRAFCRVAFANGSNPLAAGDTITVTVAGVPIAVATGMVGVGALVAANAVAAAINSTWSFPDFQAVAAGTTVGGIRYGEVANAANEVYILAPKNSANQMNTLTANCAVSTAANCAFAINGGTANASGAFANSAAGGGGTSANGLGIAAANGLLVSYPAVAGAVTKNGVWSGNGSANGTAGWFRILCTPNFDTGLTNLSTAAPDCNLIMRIDGTIGTTGADMIVSSATIASGVSQSASAFTLTVPTA